MKRLALVALVALAAPVAPVAIVTPAFADVTVKASSSGKGMGMQANMATTTQKLYSFDNKKKEADVWNMHQFAKQVTVGPMWMVKGAPGTQEYISFYKGAVEKGWIFSDPRGAKLAADLFAPPAGYKLKEQK